VVRLRVPDDEEIVIRDQVFGEVRKHASELDDFVIIKADGFPTYHFAVVVDDELMKISHVIRAQEHLINTGRHLLIQRALGFAEPTYAHVSIITNPDKSKMSKRDKDKALRAEVKRRALTEPPRSPSTGEPVVDPEQWSWWLSDSDHQLELEAAIRLGESLRIALPEINVDDFRRAGYLPDVMVNYLALLGWSPGGDIEKFDRRFLIEKFDLGRVIASPAAFDRDKLLSFNLDALHALPADEFVARYREHCLAYRPEFIRALSPAQFDMLARANQPRSKTLDDTIESSRFFIAADDSIEIEQSKPVLKALTGGEPSGYDHLEALTRLLRDVPDWSVPNIEAAVRAYVDEHAGGNLGKAAQPLRIAVSGGMVSPAIFETLAILGRDSVLRRIERCLQSRNAMMTSTTP
jgi:glutamyl-tRNA synthetase